MSSSKAKAKIDWGYIIRTTFCALVFLAATAYFSHVCLTLANNYALLVNPTSAASISWLINLGVSTILFMITLGVTVVLIRPTWIAMICYAISAALYVFFIGSGMATWITAGVLFVILLTYLISEVNLFKNQIKSSTHPLGEKKMLVASLLAALLSVAIGVGYYKDSVQRNFAIPPEAETAFSQYLIKTAKSQIETQKIEEKEKQAALGKVEENVKKIMEEQKKALEPIKTYIPYILGITAFFIFQMLLILVGIVSMIFIPLLFWLLSITHFTHITTERCEVTRLTLKSTD